MISTGDDDLINPEEKGDLEYRKQQLKRLQEEVVDMEDMSTGISIMDLGLNEFRLDLLDYIKTHGDLAKKPKGLHAVVPATAENRSGVIFVLRNINNSVNIDNQNRIHPFYMVYISVDGEVICDYLNPKKLLDTIRLLCRGKSEPIMPLCAKFNEETDDGRNMIIDVVFADDKKVRTQWKVYYDKLCVGNPTEEDFKKIESEQCKLLEAIAKSLGYKNKITWETIQNPYIPKGLSTAMMQQQQYQDGQLEIMEMMKSMFPMKSGGSSDGQAENGNS